MKIKSVITITRTYYKEAKIPTPYRGMDKAIEYAIQKLEDKFSDPWSGLQSGEDEFSYSPVGASEPNSEASVKEYHLPGGIDISVGPNGVCVGAETEYGNVISFLTTMAECGVDLDAPGIHKSVKKFLNFR